MGGDQFVARKRGPPIALAASDKYDLALFVGKPIVRSLDGEIGAPLALARARVREHIGPPFFARGLLRVRPGTVLDGITRLYHGGDQPRDLRPLASSKAKFSEVAVICPNSPRLLDLPSVHRRSSFLSQSGERPDDRQRQSRQSASRGPFLSLKRLFRYGCVHRQRGQCHERDPLVSRSRP